MIHEGEVESSSDENGYDEVTEDEADDVDATETLVDPEEIYSIEVSNDRGRGTRRSGHGSGRTRRRQRRREANSDLIYVSNLTI